MTRRSDPSRSFDTVVLDVDGTLVDSVYAHVWSWREAFRAVDVVVPTWSIHRAIGMGGDRLVEAVTSAAVEHAKGDQVRDRQSNYYRDLFPHVVPTRGAAGLLEALKASGVKVVLASSGSRDDTENAVALLESAQHCIDATVTGDDIDATKPDTEPVQRAVDRVDGRHALVVGDAVWDMESAGRAGHTPIGLRSGGIADCELRRAGAAAVYDDPAALTAALTDVLTGRALERSQ